MLFNFPTSLLILCLVIPSIFEGVVRKFPTIIVELSISPYNCQFLFHVFKDSVDMYIYIFYIPNTLIFYFKMSLFVSGINFCLKVYFHLILM